MAQFYWEHNYNSRNFVIRFSFFAKSEVRKTEKDKVPDGSYPLRDVSAENGAANSQNKNATSEETKNTNDKSDVQKLIDITNKNSKGYKVVLAMEHIFDGNKKFKFDSKTNTLYVANYLGQPTGDNLWLVMNDWYRGQDGFGKYYPLINAQENNWKGNDEWAKQLEAFIKYLRRTKQLSE